MKILVTGSRGMVGRNLVEALRKTTHNILDPSRGELDLLNFAACFQYLRDHKPDFIIHCAGRVGGIQANIANPVAFLTENIDINRNLIMAAQKAGIQRMLNLGSSCMYPRNAPNPLTEDLILKGELEPTNEGYALAKIFAQRLCNYIYQEDKSFDYKTLVPCNLYGPYDKFDPQNSHLIPAIIYKLDQALAAGKTEVDIWGTGEARREFMYVGDLISCILHSLNHFETMPRTMNVGLGFDHSVNEYYEVAAKVMGYQGRFVHDTTKPVGMKQKLVSTQLADQWGWKQQYSLEQGLELTIKYYQELKKK